MTDTTAITLASTVEESLETRFRGVLERPVESGAIPTRAIADALADALLRQVDALLTERQARLDARGEPEAAYELRYIRDALLRTADRRWYR